jgi:hypothetical protein
MPNLEEHCKHTLKRYGFEGREVHKWLDEPSRVYGGIHRGFRHDEKTVILAGKLFGKDYGEGIVGDGKAQTTALDHIRLDLEDSLRKRLERNEVLTPELKAYEEEIPKYEQKTVELKKLVDEYSKLPEISTREISEYLEVRFGNKKPESKALAEIALRHWQSYLLTRDNTNREIDDKDIFRFISQLKKKVNATTRSNYLGQLVPYFKHAYNDALAKSLQQEKAKSDKEKNEKKKNSLPLRVNDIKLFYQKGKLAEKIAIRLLLLEDIPIKKLGKICAVQYVNGQYHFLSDDKKEIQINSETANLAIPLIQKNKNDKLLNWEDSRNLADRFQKLSEKLNIEPNITPMDLRKFGKNHHPDDLKDLLSDASSPKL